MPKKLVDNLISIMLIIVLGSLIYHLFLSPSALFNKDQRHHSSYPTEAFFATTLANENNIPQLLSQYKGKVLVVNFWATWCPPCRREMPELSLLHVELKNKNAMVLGLAVDEMKSVKAFNQSTPVQYPLLIAEDNGMSLSNELGNDKGVLPYTVIINRQGQVVKSYFGQVSKALLSEALQPYL